MTTASTPQNTAPRHRWIWITLALTTLIGIGLLFFDVEDTADVQQASKAASAPVVSVITVGSETAQAAISAFAEVKPRWDIELRAVVSGRITHVHPAALAGAQADKGAPLFSIEKTTYQSAVALAETELEQSKLALLRAQNEVAVTQKQFERDGREPPTELAARLPQLRIAQKTFAASQARLASARRDLAETEVTAPFSGFVTDRAASLGQTVNPGDLLLHLSDNHHFELMAEFSQKDWDLLDHPINGKQAQLIHRDGHLLGQARIRRSGGFLDPKTRQVRVFLDVLDPNNQILAGDFIRVSIAGRRIADTVTLPESTLTRSGHVWMVDADSLLQRFRPDILFRTEGKITLRTPKGQGPWQIAKTPLASFLPGQRVTPKFMEE
jgi:RND family efflux transporter MFP subunit